MEAIILAGGMGTRLKSMVKDVPKPMALVAGKPFLEHILVYLKKCNFNRIILAVGYKYEVIKDYFNDSFLGMEIIYSIEDTPLGTGGCIKKALGDAKDEYVYVINGDTFFEIDFSKMQTKNDIAIACKKMFNFDRYGEVKIEGNRITSFEEKKEVKEGYINGGIYLLKKDIFKGFPLEDRFSLEIDFFQKYMNELYIEPFLSEDYFIDIGIPEDYKKAMVDFSE